MKKYKFAIKDKQGERKKSTTATNIISALKLLSNSEDCLKGAVINIKIKKLEDDKSKV